MPVDEVHAGVGDGIRIRDTIRLLNQDLGRYVSTGKEQGSRLSVVLCSQGFWASTIFRFSGYFVHKFGSGILSRVCRAILVFPRKLIEVLTGICLFPQCSIGGGLYIGHFGPIIVNPRSKLGENCNLSQGVTIGEIQSGMRKGVPIIGDRVYIGPNAVVVGNIQVGNDAAIGAGAVVVHPVPPRAVVVGNPARIVSFEGSFDLIRYEGMSDDPSRQAAMKLKGQSDPDFSQ